MRRRRPVAALLCLALLLPAACIGPAPGTGRASGVGKGLAASHTDLDVQALVMEMADEGVTALVEALQPIINDQATSSATRAFAQSFLRAGAASAVDIAVGPTPDVAILDMLVLVSLGRWSFDRQWPGLGIPDAAGRRAAARMAELDDSVWKNARAVLSEPQLATLSALVKDWQAAHPDRTDVAFVRFSDFNDLRDRSGRSNRVRATGLLREVTEASAVVDSTRLLGERVVWLAGRYPKLLSLQAESTVYHLADQPEIKRLTNAIDATARVSDALAKRLESLDTDLAAQQELLFSKIAGERERTLAEARAAVEESARVIGADFETRVAAAREAAVDHTFDRLSRERREFLDDLEAREGTLRAMAVELRDTIGATAGLAKELTGTVEAIDRIVERFDQGADPNRKPIEITDIRDAAVESARAAEKMTVLLERAADLTASNAWDQRLAAVDHATTGVIDRVFWRGLALVGVLIAGLALVRLVPQRFRKE